MIKSNQQEPQFMQVSSQVDEQDNVIGIGKKYTSSSTVVDKMKETIFEQDPTKTEIDYKNLKHQTTTEEARKLKKEVNGKSLGGIKFDANGNLTIKYETCEYNYNSSNSSPQYKEITTNETFTFWGTVETNKYGEGNNLYDLYYNIRDIYTNYNYYN